MPKKLKNWGGKDTDTTFQSLANAMSSWGWGDAGLHDIVNGTMLFFWKAAHEPGIGAFNGGHVRLADGKRFYNAVKRYIAAGSTVTSVSSWLPFVGMTPRGGNRDWSQSHPSDDAPYEVTMPMGWGCLLVGTKDGGSWFQTEATSVKRGWGSMVYHTVKDYVSYKASGLQQGPAGTSTYSDKNPLRADNLSCNEVCNYLVFL